MGTGGSGVMGNGVQQGGKGTAEGWRKSENTSDDISPVSRFLGEHFPSESLEQNGRQVFIPALNFPAKATANSSQSGHLHPCFICPSLPLVMLALTSAFQQLMALKCYVIEPERKLTFENETKSTFLGDEVNIRSE